MEARANPVENTLCTHCLGFALGVFSFKHVFLNLCCFLFDIFYTVLKQTKVVLVSSLK